MWRRQSDKIWVFGQQAPLHVISTIQLHLLITINQERTWPTLNWNVWVPKEIWDLLELSYWLGSRCQLFGGSGTVTSELHHSCVFEIQLHSRGRLPPPLEYNLSSNTLWGHHHQSISKSIHCLRSKFELHCSALNFRNCKANTQGIVLQDSLLMKALIKSSKIGVNPSSLIFSPNLPGPENRKPNPWQQYLWSMSASFHFILPSSLFFSIYMYICIKCMYFVLFIFLSLRELPRLTVTPVVQLCTKKQFSTQRPGFPLLALTLCSHMTIEQTHLSHQQLQKIFVQIIKLIFLN